MSTSNTVSNIMAQDKKADRLKKLRDLHIKRVIINNISSSTTIVLF